MNRKITLAFLIGVILIGFGLGVYFGKNMVICPICPPSNVDFSLFWETWNTLEDKYVDPEKLDTQELIYGAISGMLEALDDPYTIFMDPENSKIFSENISGKFEGVGMEIGIREGYLQVISPLEGTPAQKAGLRPGDRIIKVDGEETKNFTIEDAVGKIRGPKGSEVVLTIFREDWGETRDVSVVRSVIKIPSLKWEMKEDNIAHIRLYHFTQGSRADFRKAAIEILNSPAERIVLDMRNNPGGYLTVVQDIGGWFFDRGELIALEDFGEGETEEYKSEGSGQFSEYPVVCLINEGSASGAEILAGALRDNNNVSLIGKQSYGKGSVQELIALRNGSHVKVTIAKWLTPKGLSITDVGLTPDIEVELTEDDYNAGRDPQLEKAIEVVKSL